MAQKLFLCEGLYGSELLANNGKVAAALADGYKVVEVEGFTFMQKPSCYLLMEKADLVVAAPLFSLEGGEDSVSVSMTCATDGADIYYTVDESTPSSSKTKYTAAATLSATTTIKAIAIKDGVESEVVTFTYTAPAAAAADSEES